MQTPYWFQQKQPDGSARITITLWPYRSLWPRGFRLLMISILCLSFAISTLFFVLGAWPVIGFMGLEIGFVWFLFRRNYRAGEVLERLDIGATQTSLTSIDWRGKEQKQIFNSPWLSAEIQSADGRQDKLMLRLHGQKLEIGSFLPPIEKPPLAAALNAAFQARQSYDFDQN